MKISKAGVNLIANFEGFVGHPYLDAVGVWTVGYGHTGNDVFKVGNITHAEGLRLLDRDLNRFESAVNSAVRVPLTQGQFDALVSFAYNVGEGALRGSTLLRKLNARDYRGAQREFGKWVNGGGRVLGGLVRRRAAEAKLFGSASHAPSSPLTKAERRLVNKLTFHRHARDAASRRSKTWRTNHRWARWYVARIKARMRAIQVAARTSRNGWKVRQRGARYQVLKKIVS